MIRNSLIDRVSVPEDVILRVGRMAETHPEIVEMDCNPVIVLTDRAVVVDARVRVEPAAPGERRGGS